MKHLKKIQKRMGIITLLFLAMVITLEAKMKWNMPTGYGDGYFQTKNIREFVAEINKETKGELEITVHSGASLFPTPEIFKAVRGGQAEMGELLMANLGNEDPIYNIDNIPFLATGYGEAKKLWESSRKAIETKLNRAGVILLYAVPWPAQNFYSKEKFDGVSFFKGRKLRAYNAITSEMANLLGAAPVTIQVPEIPQAFSTGIIDAMITSGATGVSSQSWDYIKYFTEVEAWLPKNMVFINKRTWNRLSKKNQAIILKAAKTAEERGWGYSAEVDLQDRITLAKNGIELVKPNRKMLADLKAVGNQMTKSWLKNTGREGQNIINAYKKSL